jgi:hypothetical protein
MQSGSGTASARGCGWLVDVAAVVWSFAQFVGNEKSEKNLYFKSIMRIFADDKSMCYET